MDGRRRRWVPLDARFPHTATPCRLKQDFGRDGLLVWALLLAACKRSPVQGTLTFTSEEAAWIELGLADPDDRPGFTLESFFRATGQLKQTRQTRSGHLVNVEITRWEDWQDGVTRRIRADQKARKRAETRPDIPEPIPPPDLDRDLDLDQDQDRDQHLLATAGAVAGARPPRSGSQRPRPRDPIWDALEVEFGRVADGTSAHGCRNKAVSDLRRLGATPESIGEAIRAWPDWFENATLTDAALAKHYPRLTSGPPPVRSNGNGRRTLTAEEVRSA